MIALVDDTPDGFAWSRDGADRSTATVWPVVAIAVAVGIVQLVYGSGIDVVALAVASLVVSLLPLACLGRDIYALLSAAFGIRYVGAAMLMKTFYGQTLESNLLDAVGAYGLTFCVIVSTTGAIAFARWLDRGRLTFPTPDNPAQLRLLSLAFIAVGSLAELVEAASKSTTSGEVNAGVIFNLASNGTSFFIFGLVCEATFGYRTSEGASFVTPRLLLLIALQLVFALALNVREFFLTCVLSVAAMAYLYRCLHWRHLVLAAVAGVFFMTFLSPITLFLRTQKEGMSFQDFISLARTTVSAAATDPAFLYRLAETQKYQSLFEEGLVPYDYYGDRSNVANRLSYVALLDAVHYGMSSRKPLGLEGAGPQILGRTLPSFLVPNKEQMPYTYGDWLSWQAGMSEPGRAYSANFGLAQEGYARFGLLGLMVFPFLFITPFLWICASVSTFRAAAPGSVFFFMTIQHSILEGVSDVYIGSVTHALPVLVIGAVLIYQACGIDWQPLLRSRED